MIHFGAGKPVVMQVWKRSDIFPSITKGNDPHSTTKDRLTREKRNNFFFGGTGV
jgi:hypothetical protein